jgi:hypothetical protein
MANAYEKILWRSAKERPASRKEIASLTAPHKDKGNLKAVAKAREAQSRRGR